MITNFDSNHPGLAKVSLPECEENPSCTQPYVRSEIPKESQTFDFLGPNRCRISANPECLQQKRVYTSLGSSCPQCVHQSWAENQGIVPANTSKPYGIMFCIIYLMILMQNIMIKNLFNDKYRCMHFIRLVYALSACKCNIDMHIHIIL